jgi:hypothetical protein
LYGTLGTNRVLYYNQPPKVLSRRKVSQGEKLHLKISGNLAMKDMENNDSHHPNIINSG